MQIFADVFNLPARRNAINGCASLGAAINTAVGLGLYPNYETAIEKMVRVKDVFTPIYTSIILPDTQKISRPFDRKTAVVSLTRTLAESQAFAERYAKRGWTITCQALLQLLINPPLPPAADDNIIEDRDVDELGFGAAFTALNTCKQPPKDPFPDVQDVKAMYRELVERTVK